MAFRKNFFICSSLLTNFAYDFRINLDLPTFYVRPYRMSEILQKITVYFAASNDTAALGYVLIIQRAVTPLLVQRKISLSAAAKIN